MLSSAGVAGLFSALGGLCAMAGCGAGAGPGRDDPGAVEDTRPDSTTAGAPLPDLAGKPARPEETPETEPTTPADLTQTQPRPEPDPGGEGAIVPLYGPSTALEPEVHFDRGDAVVTRFADRARDRHAREDQFQSYEHYLPFYWEYRTIRAQFVDRVAKGGSSIDVAFVTEWKLGPPEFRAWYYGMGTVAHYSGNYAPRFAVEGPATYGDDLERIDDDGIQYKYTYTIESAIELDGSQAPLSVGQFMEIEISQFLDAPPRGRDNYYGTVFLYEVGRGGLVPWQAVGDFDDKGSERENSHKLDERAWLGGRTTLAYPYSGEPDNDFMQMATNLSTVNGQPFVRGRRVHHTDMLDGHHDESAENGIFEELRGLVGPNYVNRSCDGCHHRNGRAAPPAPGEPLSQWVFKVGTAEGQPDPEIGSVLQPHTSRDGAPSEGEVSIARWVDVAGGLRVAEYAFTGRTPALYSARVAPPLVGMGLLEAIEESSVLALEDAVDSDADGISGRARRVTDPVTGELRLGRFGWKAGATSVRHQVAGALNTDMGVMTTLLPEPDCGPLQSDCGNEAGAELADEHLRDLVKYISLLGVRPRRAIDDAQALRGEAVFDDLACGGCHVPEFTTSPHHPLAELRGQVIHPYTDLLVHDMGPELAATLSEGDASGSEWRTAPLWSLGLSACVTGGVEGPFQKQTCTPKESYLHDGRARTIEEAILWHGGEAEAARDAFVAASDADRAALLAFLRSL